MPLFYIVLFYFLQRMSLRLHFLTGNWLKKYFCPETDSEDFFCPETNSEEKIESGNSVFKPIIESGNTVFRGRLTWGFTNNIEFRKIFRVVSRILYTI